MRNILSCLSMKIRFSSSEPESTVYKDFYVTYNGEDNRFALQPNNEYIIDSVLGKQKCKAISYRDCNGIYTIGFYYKIFFVFILLNWKSKMIKNIELD